MNEQARNKIIVRTSLVGIVTNVLLAAVKATVGLLANSIAVVLDAVNNLSDALSSVITIVGAKLAGKRPDKKHPLGYGRIEYLSAMIVSGLVLYAGITALFCGVMELVPMIGSGVPYIIMSIVQFLLGNTAAGFQILFLTLGLQLLRRVLEPKLMSDSIGITPLESLVGMFVGMRFGGIIGLIGGPVLMSVLVGALRGRIFESMKRDFFCLVAYLKKRWQPAEPVPADVPDQPEEPGAFEPPAEE